MSLGSTPPSRGERAVVNRPRAVLVQRPLHFFILIDCSGSMASAGKIASLNIAVREMLPHLSEVAATNPHAEILVRVIRFSTGAEWHLATPTPPDEVDWQDLQAGGFTDLGAALDLVSGALTVPPMEDRAFAPAIVLISDGMPTDSYRGRLDTLLALPWGRRAVRMAIAIGHDADYETLNRFIADPSLEPVTAANPEQLMLALRWASMQVSQAASTLAPIGPPPRALVTAWEPDEDEDVVW